MTNKHMSRMVTVLMGGTIIFCCAAEASIKILNSNEILATSSWIVAALVCLGITIRMNQRSHKIANVPHMIRYVPTSCGTAKKKPECGRLVGSNPAEPTLH